METVSNDRTLLKELLNRLAEPAKYKIKFYQIAVLMYIDHLLTLVIDKYMFFRVKIEEKKTNMKVIKFEQTQIKLDIFSKENLKRTRLLIEKFKQEAKHAFGKFQSMNEDCVRAEDTPDLFCEPYIHTGFRPINKPYWYYVKSLFTKHNETVNAWSHYIGAIYCIYSAFTLDFSDPYSWPLLSSLLTSTVMFFSSATAHLMHQKSHYCHMTCFLCDFGGISFNAFGSAFMQIYMCSPIWYYKSLEPYLMPLLGLQSALCCLLNSIAQTKYKRPYPPIKRFLQFAPCGLQWFFTLLPVLISLVWPGDMVLNYTYHFLHVFVFLLGAALFALDIPQRFFPGKLDFFGQGHNLFHMCIFLVVVFQFNGCYKDFVDNRDRIAASRLEPTRFFCFASLAALVTYFIYIVYNFNRMIAHNFDDEGNLIEKCQENEVAVTCSCNQQKEAETQELDNYDDDDDDSSSNNISNDVDDENVNLNKLKLD